MGEDLKNLEDVLKDKDTKLWIGEQGIQAIENLLLKYKELEEDLQYNKDYIKELQKKLTNAIEIKYIHQDYIPKSKIKNKIQELKEGTYDAKIILQQLLED